MIAEDPIGDHVGSGFGALREKHVGGADAKEGVVDAGVGADQPEVGRYVVGVNIEADGVVCFRVGREGAAVADGGCTEGSPETIGAEEERHAKIIAEQSVAVDFGMASEFI